MTVLRRPYVVVNVAASLDGKIDTFERRGAPISSDGDRYRVDALRAASDAVMVGGRTLLDEDPRLTVKSNDLRAERLARGLPEQPAKIGIISTPLLRADARFLTAGRARIILFTTATSVSDVRPAPASAPPPPPPSALAAATTPASLISTDSPTPSAMQPAPLTSTSPAALTGSVPPPTLTPTSPAALTGPTPPAALTPAWPPTLTGPAPPGTPTPTTSDALTGPTPPASMTPTPSTAPTSPMPPVTATAASLAALTGPAPPATLIPTPPGSPTGPLPPGSLTRTSTDSPMALATSGAGRDLQAGGPVRSLLGIGELRQLGVEIYGVGDGRVDLAAAMGMLAELGIDRVLVEGGGSLNFELLRLGLVDEVLVYVAPLIFGGASSPTLADGSGLTRDLAVKLSRTRIEPQPDGGVLLRYKVEAT